MEEINDDIPQLSYEENDIVTAEFGEDEANEAIKQMERIKLQD
jgi:hypothetical protein